MLIVFVAYRLGCCFCQPRDIYATSGARTAAWEAEKWDEKEGSLACLWCLAGQFRALTQFILLYFGWATKGKLSFLPVETKKKSFLPVGCIFQCAAGKCLYDRLKLFPVLLSPSTCPLLRSDKRVLTNNPSKYLLYVHWTPINQMVQTIYTWNG